MINALRRLLAVLALAFVSVGAPALLLHFTGSPVQSRVPALAEIRSAMMRPEDGSLLFEVIRLIAWGCWAVVAYTIVVEIVGRLRQKAHTPHLPGTGGIRRMISGLVTAATLSAGSSVSALAAELPPPAAVTAPPHHHHHHLTPPPPPTDQVVYRVGGGDTLSRIAERKLGDAQRWKEIWHLNAHHRQNDGSVFDEPDVIQPGWRLRMPSTHRQEPRTPPEPQTPPVLPAASTPAPVTAPVAPSRAIVRTTPATVVTIELPSGTVVGLAFASGISVCLAATRLHRRRLRRFPSTAPDLPTADEPPVGPAAEAIHRANVRTKFIDRDQAPPSDFDMVRAARSIEVPEHLAIGVRGDGTSCDLRLPGLDLALTGPGADNAARAMVLGVLAQSDNFRAEVVMSVEDAEALLGDQISGGVAGLKLLPTAEEAIAHLEDAYLSRSSLLIEREADNVRELLERDPGEVLPVMLLVMSMTGKHDGRLEALMGAADRCGLGTLLLARSAAFPAEPESRTWCDIESDGSVGTTVGTEAAHLRDCRLFVVVPEDAPQLVGVMSTAHPHDVCDDPADDAVGVVPPAVGADLESPSPSRPGVTPARLIVLGTPMVLAGESSRSCCSGLSLELLTFLALHPDGATRDEICINLWSDPAIADASGRFHPVLRRMRDQLRAATGLDNTLFVHAEGERYRINTELISVDLWDVQRAIADARSAPDEPRRIQALRAAAALIRGPFADGASYEWAGAEQYSMTRAHCDALAELAGLLEYSKHDEALEALELARTLDPDHEETYEHIIKILIRLGRFDAARRTARLLRVRMGEIGESLSPRICELLDTIKRRP